MSMARNQDLLGGKVKKVEEVDHLYRSVLNKIKIICSTNQNLDRFLKHLPTDFHWGKEVDDGPAVSDEKDGSLAVSEDM